MECMVPLEVTLTTEHADVESLEPTVGTALAEVGRALRTVLVAARCLDCPLSGRSE